MWNFGFTKEIKNQIQSRFGPFWTLHCISILATKCVFEIGWLIMRKIFLWAENDVTAFIIFEKLIKKTKKGNPQSVSYIKGSQYHANR